MVSQSTKTLEDLVKHLGQYPEEALLFVREGLSFAADRLHGPETEAHRALAHYLADKDLDWNDLISRYYAGELPNPVVQVIDAAGGCEKLNRHVSGRELCWALRDYALQRWGLMARVVLESWRIRSSADFGRIVFGFIDFDLMRKQDEDQIEDFNNVYAFDEVFETPFRTDFRHGPDDAGSATDY